MKALVTGAGGFIGAALVKRLLSSDTPFPTLTEIKLVDQRLAGMPNEPRVRAVEGDCGDPNVLREAVQADVDLIFHLASISSTAARCACPASSRVRRIRPGCCLLS